MAYDPHRLESVDAIRKIVGEPIPAVGMKVFDSLDEQAIAYVERAPLVMLGTSDADGLPDVSPKGDGPGFVCVEDARTLLVPDRVGNRLIFSLQNLLANPRIGLLFLVPGTPETLRVQGRAELTRDPAFLARLSARGKPAQLAIRVHVERCYFHCAKAFLRSSLWRPETWPERLRVSFGKQLARKLGGGDSLAAEIDTAVERDARENL